MWYYDEYLNSPDIRAQLIAKSESKGYSDPIYGIVNGFPQVGVEHQWKEGTQDIVSRIIGGTKHYFEDLKKSAKAGAGIFDAEYNRVIQENQNLMKQFAGTEIDLTIPEFSIVFMCGNGENTRQEAFNLINTYTLFGEVKYEASDFIQYPPNKFQYDQTFSLTKPTKGSFSISTKKYTIKNLLPTSVKITMSDNLIAEINCPLFIKIDISFTLSKKLTAYLAESFLMNR